MGALDLLFPKKCVVCKSAGEYLCPNCFATISFATTSRCLLCDKPSFNNLTHPRCRTRYSIDGCFSGVLYKGAIKKLLYCFKYQPYLSGLTSALVEMLYESLIQNETYLSVVGNKPLFVPIPLSAKRFRERGYNQSQLVAKGLAKLTNGNVQDWLTRAKETKPQFGLSKEERRENMKGAFSLKSQYAMINGQASVFLVDDVVTTGSTLVEAANILKRNGFEKVYGLTFAQD